MAVPKLGRCFLDLFMEFVAIPQAGRQLLEFGPELEIAWNGH